MSSNLLHIVDFKTEKIIGVIKEEDYWEDLRKWELKNNVDQFEFTTTDGTKIASKLIQQNLIVKRVRDGSFVSYIITEAEQDSVNRYKKIHALGEHTKLKKAKVIKPQDLLGYTVNEAMDFALEGMKWKRGITEYSGVRTIHIKEFTNPLDLLKQIASAFDLEIRFRTEVQGSFIVGRYVDMVQKVGHDNGKEFVLGKDIRGIRRIENSQDIVTALVGVGSQNNDTGEYLTFETINGGKLYVGDNDALQRWSEDGTHLFDIYSPQTEDKNMTPQRLMQLTKTELKKRINSTVTYEVDAVALEKVFGLSHEEIGKGDIVRIKDTKFNPPLFLEARLIAADECDTDPLKDKYYFGDYREVTDMRSRIDKIYAQIMGTLTGKASKELLAALEKNLQETQRTVETTKKESEAAKQLAEKVAENIKSYQTTIYEGITPPTTGLEAGKSLWLDISKGKPGILKKWNGTEWESIIPDVDGAIKVSEEKFNKELQKILLDIQNKVDTDWLNSQLKDKADKSGVYTREESDKKLDGFVSKQVYDVDKQGNIKNFSDISTKFTQTDKAISQMATKQSVTDLGNNLTSVSEVANEAKQTAEGNTRTITDIKTTVDDQKTAVGNLSKKTTEVEEKAGQITEKLTSVEQKFDSLKVGGRNLLKNSNGLGISSNNTNTYPITVNKLTEGNTDFYRVKNSNLGPDKATISLYNAIPFTQITDNIAGKQVTFSHKVRSSKPVEGILMHQIYGSSTINLPTNNSKISVSDEWKTVSVTVDIPKDLSTFTGVRFILYWFKDMQDQYVDFRDWKIEIGNVVTDWIPAQEDQVSQVLFEQKTAELTRTTDSIKQSVESITKTQTTQGQQLEQAKSTLETQAKMIEAKVDIKQVEDYVGGIGQINLIRNSRFTQGTKYWSYFTVDKSQMVVDTSTTYLGDFSCKLSVSGQTGLVYSSVTSNKIAVTPGEDIVVSAYFMTKNIDEHYNKKIRMVPIFWKSDGTQLKAAVNDFTIPNDMWVRQSYTLKAPDEAANVGLRSYVLQNGTFWMAHPMLQKANKASSYLENPNDIVDKDKLMEDLADKVATQDYNKKITEIDNRFTVNEKGIDLSAKKTDVYTKQEADGKYATGAYVKEMEGRIQVTEQNIMSTVRKGDIISAINQTAEKITIDVAKLNINADTIVKWLTTKGINADIIKIEGDKVTIDKNGITVKMLDFLYQDELGQKFSVIPRKNLIPDHFFSHIRVGKRTKDDFQPVLFSPMWNVYGNVLMETNNIDRGYEMMINALRVNEAEWITYKMFRGFKRGKKYTLSAHFRCSFNNGNRITAQPGLRVRFGKFNGTTPVEASRVYKIFPEPSTSTGKIVRYALTFTVPNDYDEVNDFFDVDVFGMGLLSNNKSCAVSGVQLVEGELPCMYDWDLAYSQLVSGELPFTSLAIGNIDTTILYNETDKKVNFTMNTAKFANVIESRGINVGGYSYGEWGSIAYFNGANGWGIYIQDSGWRKI